MNCPICFETYSNERYPYIMTLCGHGACEKCITRVEICCECRGKIENIIPNYQLGSYLNLERKNTQLTLALTKDFKQVNDSSDWTSDSGEKRHEGRFRNAMELRRLYNKLYDH